MRQIGCLILLALLFTGCRLLPVEPTPTPTLLPMPELTAVPSPTTITDTETAESETAQLYLPFTSSEAATATPPLPEPTPTIDLTPSPTPTPAYPPYDGPPLRRSDIGIQVHMFGEEQNWLFEHLNRLDVGWVKVQLSWKLYQPEPGGYHMERIEELDRFIERANGDNIQVMLGLAKAPEWSRSTTAEDGPPADYTLFREFAFFLADRYRGQVAAYELWNESNLRREWHGKRLHGAELVALLREGAAGIRAGDPNAIIISAAPATTGINDGQNAVDDRVYLEQMLAAGVGGIVDGIGVHPYGWANPALSRAGDGTSPAPSHNDHHSFFFRNTLEDYLALLDRYGVNHMLWVTEFGWGSVDNFDGGPAPGAPFMDYVSEWEQAVYTMDAFALAHENERIGPMMLWNLNFAPLLGPSASMAGYSVLRPDGSPRPLYLALQNVPRAE
jgi:polysaccharide biosynthesis protein PslG